MHSIGNIEGKTAQIREIKQLIWGEQGLLERHKKSDGVADTGFFSFNALPLKYLSEQNCGFCRVFCSLYLMGHFVVFFFIPLFSILQCRYFFQY